MTTLAETAFLLARMGWPVLPCKPDSKLPDVPHGSRSASTDINRVIDWWEENPNRNVAIATGITEMGISVDVLDVDVKPGSDYEIPFEKLRVAGMLNGVGSIIRTPSGGYHYHFSASTQGNTQKMGGSSLDVRSSYGYALVPPSVVDGKPYVLIEYAEPTKTFDLAAAKALLAPPPKPKREAQRTFTGDGNSDGLVRVIEDALEGDRHDVIRWALCRAAEGRLDMQPVIDAAEAVKDRAEVARMVKYAKEKYPDD